MRRTEFLLELRSNLPDTGELSSTDSQRWYDLIGAHLQLINSGHNLPGLSKPGGRDQSIFESERLCRYCYFLEPVINTGRNGFKYLNLGTIFPLDFVLQHFGYDLTNWLLRYTLYNILYLNVLEHKSQNTNFLNIAITCQCSNFLFSTATCCSRPLCTSIRRVGGVSVRHSLLLDTVAISKGIFKLLAAQRILY
jgi:hypothetical protein